MTPKEKAAELLEKMKFNCKECDFEFNAKQCALITVDEIIEIAIELNVVTNIFSKKWIEVKKEIEAL
jgi:hypothetical protein